jgi:hypothetical protein
MDSLVGLRRVSMVLYGGIEATLTIIIEQMDLSYDPVFILLISKES